MRLPPTKLVLDATDAAHAVCFVSALEHVLLAFTRAALYICKRAPRLTV